ncbi:hypothetical protein EDB80DRAFT_879708 [Ilyonectria destructans]|nr:hypothetical protein EDB80DRAFT_879708 [Ilyonectria destructans]
MDPALVDIRHGWSSQLSMSPMSQPTPRRPRFFAHPPSWFLDRDTSSWNPTLRVLFDVRDRGKTIRNSSQDRWEPWLLVLGRCCSDSRLSPDTDVRSQPHDDGDPSQLSSHYR